MLEDVYPSIWNISGDFLGKAWLSTRPSWRAAGAAVVYLQLWVEVGMPCHETRSSYSPNFRACEQSLKSWCLVLAETQTSHKIR